MAWSTLAANQNVSFLDAQGSGISLNAGQTNPGTNQCMVRDEVLAMYAVNRTPFNSYAYNQLVPKSIWAASTATAFTFSSMYSTTPEGSCGQPNTGLTLYSDSSTLAVGTHLYIEASLWSSFIPGDGTTSYHYHSGTNTYRITQFGLIDYIVACDVSAPTAPTGLTATSITATTCTLSWTASTDNVAVTNYLVYKNGTLSLTLGNVVTTPITGLTASTAYNFTVYARDAMGNVSGVSNTASFTTPAANQPPTAPTTFTVTRGTLQATIAWSGATDDVAVTNYEIQRSLDGTSYSFLTYDTTSPYVNTGLSSGTTYWYKMRSIDGGGLMSAFTTPKSVTII